MCQYKSIWIEPMETADSSNDAIQFIIAGKDTVTISTCKVSSSNIRFREISDVNLKNRVSAEREERKLNKTDGLFIAVAWILKSAFCFLCFVRRLCS
jgi:hypothetical protein